MKKLELHQITDLKFWFKHSGSVATRVRGKEERIGAKSANASVANGSEMGKKTRGRLNNRGEIIPSRDPSLVGRHRNCARGGIS
jgi:hypothetical protein